ncbi:MAG: NUDIX domain-containing protein [Rhodospirillales bacterium]
MTPDDVEVLDHRVPFQGYHRIETFRIRHRLFAGDWSPPIERELLERGHAVAVVLYDPDRDTLVLIEQFRIGAFAAHRTPWWPQDASPWLLEIVAGIIDEGETPETVARREAVEEAGCEIDELQFVCRFLATPGVSSETILLYVGRVDATNAGGIHGLDDESEDIRVIAAPAAEVFQWLDRGRIINATALVGLHWFRAHHRDLRARWRRPAA